jgi:predicted ArsR family transcriptional regulator
MVFPRPVCETERVDVPTRPGDALAQPTRARLFGLLNELRRPASTDELAELLELHPNGIRVHLDRMHEAGLVQRRAERRGRGRPRDVWSISPDAQPGGDPPTGYAELARWLVKSLTMGGTGVRDVEAAGRQIGRELARDGAAADGEQRLHDILVTLGFQPERRRESEDRLTYCLRNCPYREAVRERQPLVCGLHRGMTRGLLDVIEPKTKLVGFVPKDPDSAGCLIETRGPLAAQAPGEA